jgi:hypothetical protein
MKLDWFPHIAILLPCLLLLFLMDHVLDSRPLDDDLAYRALQHQLRRPEMIGNHLLNLTPAKMIERNGEAILVGKGSTQYSASGGEDVPVLENLNFEYIMIISRECHNSDAKCYKAHQVELTGEKNSLPLI